jgi:hypothetical protein
MMMNMSQLDRSRAVRSRSPYVTTVRRIGAPSLVAATLGVAMLVAFAVRTGRSLQLVSCGGVFDRATGHYLSSVVVDSHLVGVSTPHAKRDLDYFWEAGERTSTSASMATGRLYQRSGVSSIKASRLGRPRNDVSIRDTVTTSPVAVRTTSPTVTLSARTVLQDSDSLDGVLPVGVMGTLLCSGCEGA